MYVSRKSIYF